MFCVFVVGHQLLGDKSISDFPFKFFRSYLVTVMGLVTPWSASLALVDAYSVFVKGLPRQPRVLLVVIVEDWVCYKAYYVYHHHGVIPYHNLI